MVASNSHSVPGQVRHRTGPTPVPWPMGEPGLATLAFDTAPVALAVTTLDGRWVRANEALCELLGYPEEQLLGDNYRRHTHPEDLESDDEATRLLFTAGRGPAVDKRFRHADGHLLWARVRATLLRDADGRPVGIVAVAEDIAEHRDRHAELYRLALHDPLTGVRNRTLLDADIERALQTREREGGVIAVLYLDVDDFKDINDEHGHDTGDRALVLLSIRLREAVREQDTVARLGGDEFVVLAHLPSGEHARELRDRLESVCAEPLVLPDRSLSARVSVGMTIVDSGGSSATRVLASADRAMYAEKRARKNSRRR